jgi:hypothetical protein
MTVEWHYVMLNVMLRFVKQADEGAITAKKFHNDFNDFELIKGFFIT